MSSSLEAPETPKAKRLAPSSFLPSQETPLKKDWASSGVFIKGTLDEQRSAVSNDLDGGIPEVGIDFMLKHILPAPSSRLDVDSSLQKLQAIGAWKREKGWKIFKGQTPSSMIGTEDQVFSKNMEAIIRDILAQCVFNPAIPRCGVGIGTSPEIAPISRTNVRTRPDACGLLEPSNILHTSQWYKSTPMVRSYHWLNIVYTLEYKKQCNVDARNDNVLKMLWNLHHIMNVDHRRRFTYGITIEDTTARIWFCCRQAVMVSTSFDFMSNPKILIQLFSSLHYSDQAALGYDPTITYIWNREQERVQRQIIISGTDAQGRPRVETYMTTGDIISDESQIIRSRATRVYEAYNISDDSKTPIIIKDLWVDIDRKLEAEILFEILKDASPEERSLFLTVIQHGIVQIYGEEDITEGLIIRSKNLSTGGVGMGVKKNLPPGVFPLYDRNEWVEPSAAGIHNSISTEEVSLASTNVLPYTEEWRNALPTEFFNSSKAHYRLVFKERGESLHHLSLQRKVKLSAILIPAFCDIIRALEVMWRKRYVHRDVSAANIIIYKGRAKIIDLEFAKQYGAVASSPVRTGNYSFMATEILHGKYFSAATISTVFNPLHDLESLWWVGIWFAFRHYSSQVMPAFETSKARAAIGLIQSTHLQGKDLFLPHYGPKPNKDKRMEAFVNGKLLQEYSRLKFPSDLCRFCKVLDAFRLQLIEHLYECQSVIPVDPSYFDAPRFTLYDKLVQEFTESGLISTGGAVSSSDADDCCLWPIQYIQQEIARIAGR